MLMKTTLDEMIKTLTLTRLEIERFKSSNLYPSADIMKSHIGIKNFLQQITNTLLDLQEKVVDIQKEIER